MSYTSTPYPAQKNSPFRIVYFKMRLVRPALAHTLTTSSWETVAPTDKQPPNFWTQTPMCCSTRKWTRTPSHAGTQTSHIQRRTLPLSIRTVMLWSFRMTWRWTTMAIYGYCLTACPFFFSKTWIRRNSTIACCAEKSTKLFKEHSVPLRYFSLFERKLLMDRLLHLLA